MTIDHDDVAAQLVYLVIGTESKVDLHCVTERLKGTHGDHPLRAGGGHTGMVTDLLPYAKQVSAYLTSKAGEQDFPGVFEYEVTESLGAWLADNWESAGPQSFQNELEAQGAAFFAQ
jgi:hypothetical protein